jgi:hypothetical protein
MPHIRLAGNFSFRGLITTLSGISRPVTLGYVCPGSLAASQDRQPGAVNDRERAGSPAGPGSGTEGRSELKHGGPPGKIEGQRGQAPPGGTNRPDIFPVTPRNAAPDRTPGMIEGHQGRTAPILTRDHEAGVNYGSICSIYPVRFAVSGTTVALMTRDHEPSVTGTFTRSGAEPKITQSWNDHLRARSGPFS